MSQNYQSSPSGSGQSYVQPHRGTLILVLGVISLVPVLNFCGVPGIMAWIFGAADLKQMKAGIMDREGEGLTNAGYICGIIGTCFFAIGIVVTIIYVVVVFVFLGAAAAGAGAGM